MPAKKAAKKSSARKVATKPKEPMTYTEPLRNALVYIENMTVGVRETPAEIDGLMLDASVAGDFITLNTLRSIGDSPDSGPWVYDELRVSPKRIIAYG